LNRSSDGNLFLANAFSKEKNGGGVMKKVVACVMLFFAFQVGQIMALYKPEDLPGKLLWVGFLFLLSAIVMAPILLDVLRSEKPL